MSELTHPESCLNKALPQEMCFVLLGRDPAAPGAIRDWVQRRIMLGLNLPADAKIKEALDCAKVMDAERDLRTMEREKARDAVTVCQKCGYTPWSIDCERRCGRQLKAAMPTDENWIKETVRQIRYGPTIEGAWKYLEGRMQELREEMIKVALDEAERLYIEEHATGSRNK